MRSQPNSDRGALHFPTLRSPRLFDFVGSELAPVHCKLWLDSDCGSGLLALARSRHSVLPEVAGSAPIPHELRRGWDCARSPADSLPLPLLGLPPTPVAHLSYNRPRPNLGQVTHLNQYPVRWPVLKQQWLLATGLGLSGRRLTSLALHLSSGCEPRRLDRCSPPPIDARWLANCWLNNSKPLPNWD